MIEGMINKKGWLNPCDGSRSFYGKARVVMDNDEKVIILISYSTPVVVWKNGKFHRTWGNWSATTARHINSFAAWFDMPKINKKAWMAMPCEDYYTLVV